MSGGSLGSILGGAIGGITGGARGSDIGTIVGMAGGAIIGAKMGQKADQRQREDVHDHYEKVQQRKARERRDRTGYDYNNQTDDYIQPNNVVESGDFDANYFQHVNYLNSFNKEKGTHIAIAKNGKIHYEPIGSHRRMGRVASLV